MKRIIFAAFLLCVGTTLFAQPKLGFSEKNYDFGNIKQGDVVKHDFVIYNEGDEELKIEKVRASCGCTAAAPEKDVLAPGDSTTIAVSFDSNGRQGVQKKYVYVFSNDPKMKQIRLSFTTKILLPDELDAEEVKVPQLAINEKEIDFGTVISGEVENKEINILNRGKAELVVTNIKSSCDCAAATVSTKNLSPGEIAFLNIRFDSTGRTGKITRTVSLHTNDPNHHETVITIHADVKEGAES